MTSTEKSNFLTDGAAHPALERLLDRKLVGDTEFLPFQPIPPADMEEARVDWLTSSEIILYDVEELLRQPCHIFWSNLIFSDSLRANLDSFLTLSPREFDGCQGDEELVDQLRTLYRTYLRVFMRMTSCKESVEYRFTDGVYGSILYDNYILDIPKLIDICTLFGGANHDLIVKMIANVFNYQPLYLKDVKQAVPTLIKLFKDLVEKLSDDKLIEPRDLSISEHRSADGDLLDVSLYASDMPHSLNSFLQVYPPACLPFHQPSTYHVLSVFYEDVLCKLLDQLDSSTLSIECQQKAYQRLTIAQDDIISLFRLILYTSTLGQIITESLSRESSQQLVQDYYDVLTDCLGNIRFIGRYAGKFSYEDDLEIISNLNLPSDTMRQSFIRDGLLAALSQEETEKAKFSKDEEPSITSSAQQPTTAHMTDLEASGGAAGNPSATETTSSGATSLITELFPDLGAGFIELCMKYYHSTEEFVSALLEDNLPPSLQELDRSLPVAPEERSLVNSRKNVFDNDEFDVFRRTTVDTSKMHRGKRVERLSNPDTAQKDKIKELVIASEELSLHKNGGGTTFDGDIYDDEYDDTYDANEVGADDADEVVELMGRRVVVPVALGGTFKTETDDGNDADSAENNTKPQGQATAFKEGRPKYDVKGRAKGQGQSAEVIKNRNYKTAHKARGANHNRKAGARSKMSKGMF
ncbi:activating signal cointegrator 1 complex subunit 2-like [Watersipora subatra]|uniref:activating signal cointegrator 1 complex subunit 2-like n=1 Tax=Watersipora subatra TaxID=2589382 RepID=UPI00355C85BD